VSDKKTVAIVLGAAVGVAAIAATVAIYSNKHREPAERDVNDIFDEARRTVRKLDEAVDMLRSSAA